MATETTEIQDELFVLQKGVEHINELLAIPGFNEDFRGVLKLQRTINELKIKEITGI